VRKTGEAEEKPEKQEETVEAGKNRRSKGKTGEAGRNRRSRRKPGEAGKNQIITLYITCECFISTRFISSCTDCTNSSSGALAGGNACGCDTNRCRNNNNAR